VLHYETKESAVVCKWKNIVPDVDVKRKIQSFSNEIIAGGRTGYTGKSLLIL
jgi:glucose-6-phosphate isomerase